MGTNTIATATTECEQALRLAPPAKDGTPAKDSIPPRVAPSAKVGTPAKDSTPPKDGTPC